MSIRNAAIWAMSSQYLAFAINFAASIVLARLWIGPDELGLFSIAFANLYNFVLHVFFGRVAAAFIGWEDSPFQLEVGFASLGFAALGLLAFKGSLDLRLAAIVAPACFLWGAAGGHVHQMITAHNFTPGNAGVIFYSDVLVPILGFIFLWLQRRAARIHRSQ